MSLCIVLFSNAAVSSKVGLQVLTVSSTMQAELVVGAPAMKEAVFIA